MNILERIIAYKKKEVAQLMKEVQVEKLVKSPNFRRAPISLKNALTAVGTTGIIAEFKRQSPSKGIINNKASIIEVTEGYLKAEVAAQSILTDANYFGGNIVDVMKEMPITLMMRPFGWDTLAVKIYELTSEGEWERAALPAVTLIAAGLIPVILLTRQEEK